MNVWMLGSPVVVLLLMLWGIHWRKKHRTRPLVGGIDRTVSLPHTDSVELYSNSFSHCSRKVRLVLAELRVPYKHHAIDLIETGQYQTVSDAYIGVNPAGLVPTLVHDGHPIYESDDILEYAQSMAGVQAPQLVPHDAKLRAQMHHWLDFCAIVSADLMGGMKERAGACIPGLTMPMFMACIRYIPLRRILVGFFNHPTWRSPLLFSAFKVVGMRNMMAVKPLADLVHTSRDHMLEHLETIEQTLLEDNRPWILGDQFSLADVSIGCMLLRLDESGWLSRMEQTVSIERVRDYYTRLQARASWEQAIVAHEHPIVNQGAVDLRELTGLDPALGEKIYGL